MAMTAVVPVIVINIAVVVFAMLLVSLVPVPVSAFVSTNIVIADIGGRVVVRGRVKVRRGSQYGVTVMTDRNGDTDRRAESTVVGLVGLSQGSGGQQGYACNYCDCELFQGFSSFSAECSLILHARC